MFWRVYFFLYALLWLAGGALVLSGVVHGSTGPWMARSCLDVLALLALWAYAFPWPLVRLPLFWKVWLHLDVALTVVTLALSYQALIDAPFPQSMKIAATVMAIIGAVVAVLPPMIATYRLGYGRTLEEARASRFPSQSALLAG